MMNEPFVLRLTLLIRGLGMFIKNTQVIFLFVRARAFSSFLLRMSVYVYTSSQRMFEIERAGRYR